MLSKKSQYAFRALTLLTEKYKEGPILISEIAKKKKIPLKFLENILLFITVAIYNFREIQKEKKFEKNQV